MAVTDICLQFSPELQPRSSVGQGETTMTLNTNFNNPYIYVNTLYVRLYVYGLV